MSSSPLLETSAGQPASEAGEVAAARAPWRKLAATLVPLLALGGAAALVAAPARGQPAAASFLASGSKSRYKRVQYLGFNIFTAPGTAADGCFGEAERLEECYLGSLEVANDIAHRQEIMMTAIRRAFESEHWDRSPDTLKVWLAPEFYWRGARGAYRLLPETENVSRRAVAVTSEELSNEKFAHWLFVMGTVVTAREMDPRWVKRSGKSQWHIDYYNAAPIHVGGTPQKYLQFKHFISGIDFLQTNPNQTRRWDVQAPPGSSSSFCRQHPDSSACVYGTMPPEILHQFGFSGFEVVRDNVIEVGGLRIGVEICLDHAEGQLAKELGPHRTVDLQLIVSAGMNIASGPVCTRPHGPTFLADGFARTEANFNLFGQGRQSTVLMDGSSRRYNTGIVFGADAAVAMQQWITDTIAAYTGTGFGTRFAGEGSLPGGSETSGPTGIAFHQLNALGENWEDMLAGFYDTANYRAATNIDLFLLKEVLKKERRENVTLPNDIPPPHSYPTVDIYGPVPLPLS